MEIKLCNHIEILKEYDTVVDHTLKEILQYPSYFSNKDEYEDLTQRWINREELLQALLEKLELVDMEWYNVFTVSSNNEQIRNLKATYKRPIQSVVFDFVLKSGHKVETSYVDECKDLRGLHINGLKFNKDSSTILSYTAFDYCILENCKFENLSFFGSEFNHAWVRGSKFIGCSFLGSVISDSLFEDCIFVNSRFYDTHSSVFSKNVFFVCYFRNVKMNINPQEFGLIYTERLELNNNDYSTIGFNKAGSKVLDVFKSNISKNSYRKIKVDVYKDFMRYFIEMNKIFVENYTHDKYLESYYSYKLSEDFIKTGFKAKIRYLFGRYIFAYGLKWQQPIIALAIIIFLSSFIFLFCGITVDNMSIDRALFFNLNELKNTIIDFKYCLYASFCSTMNIGANFGKNTFEINVFKSILSFLGIILITIFTFNLVRKYIK